MSDAREGGIGGIGLPEIPEAVEPIPAAEHMGWKREEFEQILNEMMAKAIEPLVAEVAQLRGQVARFEAILPQYNTAFQQLDARMNALAQQVMRNTRYAALDLATKSRAPAEPAKQVVTNAAQYLQFMEPPAPPEAETMEPVPPGVTAH